jgi:hypothetical protein
MVHKSSRDVGSAILRIAAGEVTYTKVDMASGSRGVLK